MFRVSGIGAAFGIIQQILGIARGSARRRRALPVGGLRSGGQAFHQRRGELHRRSRILTTKSRISTHFARTASAGGAILVRARRRRENGLQFRDRASTSCPPGSPRPWADTWAHGLRRLAASVIWAFESCAMLVAPCPECNPHSPWAAGSRNSRSVGWHTSRDPSRPASERARSRFHPV